MKDKIKAICKKKGIPVYKLESDLAFSKGYISKLNQSNPSIDKVIKIANYLNVDMKELI